MTFNELKHICKPIDVTGPEPDTIGALIQDSRSVEPGDTFIAVRGTQVDGHHFIDEAITKGAAIIICEEPFYTDKDVCTMKVADTRELLGPLAQALERNPAKKLQIIGITGTNGKTTVATLTYQALQLLGAKPSLLGTVAKRINDEELDSLLTTADPIELARDMQRMVQAGSTHLVMEVSSHALDQQRVDGINFEVAAFTNLSHDHLDYHSDLDAYAASKKQLFDYLSDDSTAIINNDDEQASYIISDTGAEVISFSFENKEDIRCKIEQNTARGITVDVDGITIKSPMAGRFNAYNVAQTFLICRALGFEDAAIAEALEQATGAAGRLQRVQVENQKNQPLVLVDYAHTPGALENVLQSLADTKEEQETLHVIFGCGGDRDKTKRPKMAGVAEDNADIVTITSDNPRSENPDAIIDDAIQGFMSPDKVTRITDRRKAIEQTIARADEHTIILIAGKGHETYQEINGERRDFDDREIARQALAKRNGNSKPKEVY